MPISESERLRRIEHDGGDSDALVWVSRSHKSQCYHDTPQCDRVQNGVKIRGTTREAAQSTRAPCTDCVDGVDSKGQGENPFGARGRLGSILDDMGADGSVDIDELREFASNNGDSS